MNALEQLLEPDVVSAAESITRRIRMGLGYGFGMGLGSPMESQSVTRQSRMSLGYRLELASH